MWGSNKDIKGLVFSYPQITYFWIIVITSVTPAVLQKATKGSAFPHVLFIIIFIILNSPNNITKSHL